MAVVLCGAATAQAPTAATAGSDLKTIRTRMVQTVLGSVSGKAAGEAARYAGTLRPDGSWPDIDYADQAPSAWKTETHLARTLSIARAWSDPSSAGRRDAVMKDAACRALDYWIDHDFQDPNWWHNQISVPRAVGETLLLLGSEAGEARIRKAATIMARSDWETLVGTRKVDWTGANLSDMAWNRVLRGLLESKPEMVAEAFRKAFEEVRIVPPGDDGIQADMSFHQHGPLIYDAGYGEVFVGDVVRFLTIADGTPFAATPQVRDLIIRYVLDGPQWMMRGVRWDYGVLGRGISRPERSAQGFLAPLDALAALPGPRQAELQAFAQRLRGGKAPALSGNRHYWDSDFMVHERPGWYASARGYSTRTMNTDGPHNGEGTKSHYIADGAFVLMRTGEEYTEIFPAWDWRKAPGTTVEQSDAPLDPLHPHRMGTTAFVGGASDGRYGLETMDLAHDGLTAAKSWFFFDDGCVCLGAGISDESTNDVATTIEQCLLRAPVVEARRTDPLKRDTQTTETSWVLHDGVGYVFPPNLTVHLDTRPKTGRWSDIGIGPSTPVTKDVFLLWLDHGKKPSGASYEYTVVPNATAEGLDARVRQNPVTVVSNSRDLQAVRHEVLGILEAAFRKPGTADFVDGLTIGVDQPCLLVARKTGDALSLAVSNPINKPLRVQVTVTPEGLDAKSRFIVFDLPDGPLAGSSVVKTMPLKGKASQNDESLPEQCSYRYSHPDGTPRLANRLMDGRH